jgi:hypothetical protein
MKNIFRNYFILTLCIWIFSSCAILSPKNKLNFVEIEFYSRGAGIDFKAKKLLEEFIVNYTEANKVTIPYTTRKYGREGETTFVLDVSKLSKKELNKFQEVIKEQLKKANNCRIHKIHPLCNS